MQTIELHAVLPEVFSGRNGIVSDIWHREVSFKKGNTYLIEAASGTGKSSLCSFLYGYRSDYQGMICFDGENIKNLNVKQWVELRRKHLSILFQELRLFPELTALENANSATGKGFMAFAMMGMDRRFASSCTFLCQLFETRQKLTPASLA